MLGCSRALRVLPAFDGLIVVQGATRGSRTDSDEAKLDHQEAPPLATKRDRQREVGVSRFTQG